jgi:PAS domain S-box-containing protein
MKATGDAMKLRQEAERMLDQANEAAKDLAGMSTQDIANLVHELRVHQIELKMQNDELRRIQAELENARDRYVHLYDFAPTAYFTVNEKGAIAEANLTAATILDWPRANLVGQMFSRFIHREDQDAWYLHRKYLLEIGDFKSFQLRLVNKYGGDFYATLECLRAADSDGEPEAIRIAATDVTGLKRAEQALQQANATLEQRVAERTREVGQRNVQLQALAVELIEAEERERRRLADYLHDDLQQMLAAARMQLESVCQIQPHESTLSSVKQLLEESIEKSRRLSHELSPPVLQHANLFAALEWIKKYFGEQFGLHVELHSDGAQHSENAPFKVFLFRAAQELLFNVVKHGGVKTARVDLARNDGCIVLSVSDHGRGLNPETLDSATAPSGLGLLSLRERARHIGGSLLIESAPNRGSRFTLTVPLSISKSDGVQPSEADRRPEALAKVIYNIGSDVTRVLFVDDHQVMRQGLINLIGTQPGIEVAGQASNGREAIDQVKQLKPDVVVMDVSMPEMDGIEATRNIKAQWPEVRVIALSMVEDEHITRTMREAGAEAFVSKTASSAELLKAIYGRGCN